MSNPYSPILTGVGLLEGGKLTKAAKDRYVVEVCALLATGNADGKGGSPSTKIFNSIAPLPPLAGPIITNVTTLKSEPAFWFLPDPFAALLTTQLTDPTNNPTWHAIFPDLIYEKTAVAMDIAGSTPLFPIFDVTCAFPDITGFPILLPDLAIKAGIMPPPKLLLKLADLGIQLQLPSLPVPPLPPQLPKEALKLPIPPLVLLDLVIGLIKLPFDLVAKLVAPPDIGLVLNIPELPVNVLKLAFDIVIDLLVKLGLLIIVPKLFIASLLIYIKNCVAMVCTDIVGMLVGAGGALTKQVAGLTGLV